MQIKLVSVQRKAKIAVVAVALGMVLYHLVSSQVLLQSTIAHLNTHLGFCLFLVFLAGFAESKGRMGCILCLVLALLSLVATGYVQVLWPELQLRAYFNTTTDLIIGVLLIILALEATRRELGLILPLFAIIVVVYPFIGRLLPEPLHCICLGLPHLISKLSIALESGVYGFLNISVSYIFLFIVFGGILRAMGATDFFLHIGRLVAGKLQGGPALMAVVSSGTVGSIIGSAAANIAITGSFTIPLMKKVGYKPEQAAGIEAAASNGGQIMPPIMGMVAFGMAGLTGIPYINIIAMAILPAILYFLCCFVYVYLRARQLDIGTMAGEKVKIRELLLSSPSFIIPFIVVIFLLTEGYTVMYVAFWAIISSIVVALIRKRNRPSLGAFIDGFAKGARTGAGIGASVAVAGLIAATFTMSGLGVKLSSGIEAWSGGHLLLGLMIVWVICVVLGFVGVALTGYIVVSIFAVPAMSHLGVPFEISHFFVMFIAVFAFITPPVAVVALIAARLAGATYIKSAIEATKVAIAGFLLPFMFIYCPILLLQPQQPLWEVVAVLACIVSLFALQVAFVGCYIRKCSLVERILASASAILLLVFLPLQSYLLFLAGIALFALLTLLQWKKLTPSAFRVLRG